MRAACSLSLPLHPHPSLALQLCRCFALPSHGCHSRGPHPYPYPYPLRCAEGLIELIKLNVESAVHARASGLTKADGKLLGGALTFKDHTVGEVQTGA